MLLNVGRFVRFVQEPSFRKAWLALFVFAALAVALRVTAAQTPQQNPANPAPAAGQQAPVPATFTPAASTEAQSAPAQNAAPPPRAGLNIVVLDPAHGGT